jgi:hypothetical protein
MHTKPEELQHLYKQIAHLAHGQALTTTITLADQTSIHQITIQKSSSYNTVGKDYAVKITTTTDTLTAEEAVQLLQAQTQTITPKHYTTDQLKILRRKIKRELKTRYKEKQQKKKTA